ncbi:hypothetical protein TFLX_05946 [Thermoflexales bacterium]|nr:hypothetical protein TFLX_05946 [Thermoflexales bacterium]
MIPHPLLSRVAAIDPQGVAGYKGGSGLGFLAQRVGPELEFITSLRVSAGLPDVVNCPCIHIVAPQGFDVAQDLIEAHSVSS